jgi:hypothetical protein
MVKEFEVGKYYRWAGPTDSSLFGNWHEDMNAIFDGKPHKCVKVEGMCTTFEGVPPKEESSRWYWGHVMEYFEEVPEQPLLPGLTW